ncbi:DUF2064 domain-containing protein [Herbidospora sp. NEAU-GS84]|uniref:DUF2064 domain-containing protein n=1 Tax=Herbidospora solisilvae TaxID=2696284 RepID=A0A7C9J3S4_9ACTN|nr:DUF2064 domain-containing protein [Herbidospora solisilvae]NAS23882.1 DUF2064 domain-containing protein [Herbidospora solisilvae]
MTTLLVIAKEPVPGRVKTRLTPPFTPSEAAALAEASLADTLSALMDTPADRRVLVLDGSPGPWTPPGLEIRPQCGGGLDERLAAAFAACAGPALLIGMDTPQVTPGLLEPALDFSRYDAWFGPADDGGFWALGLRDPDPALLLGVPMSVPQTGSAQRARLRHLKVGELPALRDVDTAADAREVAAQAPWTRFARAHLALSAALR